MEEDKARQSALRDVGEKKMVGLENDKKKLETMIKIQQERLEESIQKIEQREARDQELADLVDEDLDIDNSQDKAKDSDVYVELVDYNGSQETMGSFTKMVKAQSDQGDEMSEKEGVGPPTRCIRLKEVEMSELKTWPRKELQIKMIVVMIPFPPLIKRKPFTYV